LCISTVKKKKKKRELELMDYFSYAQKVNWIRMDSFVVFVTPSITIAREKERALKMRLNIKLFGFMPKKKMYDSMLAP
jgi:hypothetical protein